MAWMMIASSSDGFDGFGDGLSALSEALGLNGGLRAFKSKFHHDSLIMRGRAKVIEDTAHLYVHIIMSNRN